MLDNFKREIAGFYYVFIKHLPITSYCFFIHTVTNNFPLCPLTRHLTRVWSGRASPSLATCTAACWAMTCCWPCTTEVRGVVGLSVVVPLSVWYYKICDISEAYVWNFSKIISTKKRQTRQYRRLMSWFLTDTTSK